MRSADPTLTASAVGTQDESAQGVRTAPSSRAAPTELAALAYYLAFVFAAGGVGVGMTLGVFIEETGGHIDPGPLTVARLGCAVCGFIVGGVAFAMGRALHEPGNELRVIRITTAIGLPILLAGWAWVLSAGF